MNRFLASTWLLLFVGLNGCSRSSSTGTSIKLPADSDVTSIELLHIQHRPGEIPTSQPIPIILKDRAAVSSILQPMRAAKVSTPCKCGHIAYLDLNKTDGEIVRWELLRGHGNGMYDIRGPGGQYTIDEAAFDQALRDAGADKLADALLPPTP